MLEIPRTWFSTSLSSQGTEKVKLLYGYEFSGESKSYLICTTDLNDVWIERLNKSQIIKKAKRFGIEDLSDKVEDLLAVFSEGFGSRSKNKTLKFEINDQSLGATDVINIIFAQDIQWRFELQKQSHQIATEFFASMNIQQFRNHAFLDYKIQQLERAIKDKDHYILYLEQNYKAVNGNEIIRKFHRMNENQVTFAKPFDMEEWHKKVGLSYKPRYSSDESDGSEKTTMWRQIEESVSNQDTWRLTQPPPAIQPLEDTKNEADHSHVKLEPYKLHVPPVKEEPDRDAKDDDYSPTKKKSPIKKSGLTSPRKRRRI
ncbi:Piso0_004856 [Millerozyma farinosa CBS 7064]|uniref:Piso0_004856 protein n=1 Tax=Pichia sorbitophila (strain ATCC MYA-4447 / BCRC 22081 / CBS 7064 / NBRC 10061 / NRRL Y-12695) TaxID=559304 RepID=G8Y3K5_PICSO|nr:Piso0_004856 [Millerozyma farinosa CBS 7064]